MAESSEAPCFFTGSFDSIAFYRERRARDYLFGKRFHSATTDIFPIFFCHSSGPVLCND